MRSLTRALLAAAIAAALGSGARAQQNLPQNWSPLTAPSAIVAVTHPTTVAGSATWTSACVGMAYSRALDVFAGLSGAATLQVQRYADAACTMPSGAAVPSSPLALTSGGSCPSASHCGDAGINDGMPYAALKVTIVDTSTATNTFVALVLVQGAE